MQFIITIIIYKLFQIKIDPLNWVVVPVKHLNYCLSNKSEDVSIKTPYLKDDSSYLKVVRAYRLGIVIKWLCFTVQFTVKKVNHEVCSIYPKGYDCDSDPNWRQKHEQLLKTEYFS